MDQSLLSHTLYWMSFISKTGSEVVEYRLSYMTYHIVFLCGVLISNVFFENWQHIFMWLKVSPQQIYYVIEIAKTNKSLYMGTAHHNHISNNTISTVIYLCPQSGCGYIVLFIGYSKIEKCIIYLCRHTMLRCLIEGERILIWFMPSLLGTGNMITNGQFPTKCQQLWNWIYYIRYIFNVPIDEHVLW